MSVYNYVFSITESEDQFLIKPICFLMCIVNSKELLGVKFSSFSSENASKRHFSLLSHIAETPKLKLLSKTTEKIENS